MLLEGTFNATAVPLIPKPDDETSGPVPFGRNKLLTGASFASELRVAGRELIEVACDASRDVVLAIKTVLFGARANEVGPMVGLIDVPSKVAGTKGP